jgi:hypothetical protein
MTLLPRHWISTIDDCLSFLDTARSLYAHVQDCKEETGICLIGYPGDSIHLMVSLQMTKIWNSDLRRAYESAAVDIRGDVRELIPVYIHKAVDTLPHDRVSEKKVENT